MSRDSGGFWRWPQWGLVRPRDTCSGSSVRAVRSGMRSTGCRTGARFRRSWGRHGRGGVDRQRGTSQSGWPRTGCGTSCMRHGAARWRARCGPARRSRTRRLSGFGMSSSTGSASRPLSRATGRSSARSCFPRSVRSAGVGHDGRDRTMAVVVVGGGEQPDEGLGPPARDPEAGEEGVGASDQRGGGGRVRQGFRAVCGSAVGDVLPRVWPEALSLGRQRCQLPRVSDV